MLQSCRGAAGRQQLGAVPFSSGRGAAWGLGLWWLRASRTALGFKPPLKQSKTLNIHDTSFSIVFASWTVICCSGLQALAVYKAIAQGLFAERGKDYCTSLMLLAVLTMKQKPLVEAYLLKVRICSGQRRRGGHIWAGGFVTAPGSCTFMEDCCGSISYRDFCLSWTEIQAILNFITCKPCYSQQISCWFLARWFCYQGVLQQ